MSTNYLSSLISITYENYSLFDLEVVGLGIPGRFNSKRVIAYLPYVEKVKAF